MISGKRTASALYAGQLQYWPTPGTLVGVGQELYAWGILWKCDPKKEYVQHSWDYVYKCYFGSFWAKRNVAQYHHIISCLRKTPHTDMIDYDIPSRASISNTAAPSPSKLCRVATSTKAFSGTAVFGTINPTVAMNFRRNWQLVSSLTYSFVTLLQCGRVAERRNKGWIWLIEKSLPYQSGQVCDDDFLIFKIGFPRICCFELVVPRAKVEKVEHAWSLRQGLYPDPGAKILIWIDFDTIPIPIRTLSYTQCNFEQWQAFFFSRHWDTMLAGIPFCRASWCQRSTL